MRKTSQTRTLSKHIPTESTPVITTPYPSDTSPVILDFNFSQQTNSLSHSPIQQQQQQQLEPHSFENIELAELEAIQGASSQVQSIGELQAILSGQLEIQSLSINAIYEDASETLDHIDRGLNYLKSAGDNPEGPFKMGAVVLLVLTLGIILFDLIE